MTSAHHEEVGRRVGAAGASDNSSSRGPGRSGDGPRGAPWHAPVSRRPGRARGPGGARRGSGACAPAAPPRAARAVRRSRAPAHPGGTRPPLPWGRRNRPGSAPPQKEAPPQRLPSVGLASLGFLHGRSAGAKNERRSAELQGVTGSPQIPCTRRLGGGGREDFTPHEMSGEIRRLSQNLRTKYAKPKMKNTTSSHPGGLGPSD